MKKSTRVMEKFWYNDIGNAEKDMYYLLLEKY